MLARGALELLWDACYEAGDDCVGTAEDIEHAVGWSGEAGMLTQALADAGAPVGAGFIERVEGTDVPVYRVHDLWHHAPDYVSNRRSREDERRREKACARCGVVYFAADPRSQYCSPACRQGGWRDRRVTERNVTVTDSNGSVQVHAHPARTPSTEDKEQPKPFLIFQASGRPDSWQLFEQQVTEWQGLYPGLDVKAECRKAWAWADANPGRRKTARGMPKFLVNWLSRATDRGGGKSAPAPAPPANRWQPAKSSKYVLPCQHTAPRCNNTHECCLRQDRERKGAA